MVLLLVVSLVAQTGEAAFTGVEVTGTERTAATIEVDISVSLLRSEGPVVIHLLLPGQREQVRPLVPRAGNRWGTLLELRRADWRVVFEDVSSGVLSEEASLTELGLDSRLLGVAPDPGRAPETPTAWWLQAEVLALATAGVILGGAWLGSRREAPRHLRRRRSSG
ncbi:MAG: hypothetical protein ACLFWM_07025 [Actinomycetota bacterium]